jgi:hypothetical protein
VLVPTVLQEVRGSLEAGRAGGAGERLVVCRQVFADDVLPDVVGVLHHPPADGAHPRRVDRFLQRRKAQEETGLATNSRNWICKGKQWKNRIQEIGFELAKTDSVKKKTGKICPENRKSGFRKGGSEFLWKNLLAKTGFHRPKMATRNLT